MNESALKVLISSLEKSRATLDSWLFVFTLFVVVGVVLEVVFVIWEYRRELHNWRRETVQPPEKPSVTLLILGLLGSGLVALGVSGELYIGAKIGAKDTSIREANDQRASLLSQLAGDAAASAKTAHDEADAVKGIADEARADAKDALEKARTAQRELARAEADAAKAQAAAYNALRIADEAGQSARDTRKQVAQANEELTTLKTPRSLTRVPELIAALKPFKGTEYVFISVASDHESIALLKEIHEVLQKAGWKRAQSVRAFPAIEPYGQDEPDFAVPVGLNVGIQISTESLQQIAFDKVPIQDLPTYLQAAGILNVSLSQFVVPKQENSVGKMANVGTGSSTIVRIAIGKKP